VTIEVVVDINDESFQTSSVSEGEKEEKGNEAGVI
jgi:hypothetical protein